MARVMNKRLRKTLSISIQLLEEQGETIGYIGAEVEKDFLTAATITCAARRIEKAVEDLKLAIKS
jgi:hypothetical protein